MEPWSSDVLWIVIVCFIVSFLLAFAVGANDVANSFATSVGSGALSLRLACVLATVFETAGAVLIGYKVSETVRKGILDVSLYENSEKELMLGSLSALGGSAVWNLLATFLGLPISGTHTIVGATIGFSLVSRGFKGVNWATFGKIVGSWFVSPILSGIISVCIFMVVRLLVLRHKQPVEPGLRILPFFYGFTVLINVFSVVHGGPKLLYMDNLPLWSVIVIALLAGVVVSIAVQLVLVPRLRKQITRSQTEAASGETPPSISMEKVHCPTNGVSNGSDAHESNGYSSPATEVETFCGNDGDAEGVAVSPNNGIVKPSGEVPLFHNPNQAAVINPTEARKPSSALPISATADLSLPEAPEVSRLFSTLQVMTASFGSFAHGGNDVSNAIGPLIAVWLIFMEGSVQQKSETPVYILFYGGVGISVGLWVWGRRVIKTIGEDLTQLTPSSGFTIELGAAFTVLMASKIGLPISTTHCKVGSVVFVGWARSSRGGVDWAIFRNIVIAWLVTVPFAAGASAGLMAILLQVAM